MIKEAMEYLCENHMPIAWSEDKEHFYYNQRYKRQAELLAEPIEIATLDGLIDFVKNNLKLDDKPFIHIASERTVYIKGSLTKEFNRHTYTKARFTTNGTHCADDYLGIETFIIFLKSDFVQDETTEKLLRIVSKMDVSDSASINDDGISQQVNVKSGVHLANKEQLPSSVHLRPYRTFPELAQPLCEFVFRVKKDRDTAKVGLFECLNSVWKIKIINQIHSYLKENLGDIDINIVR